MTAGRDRTATDTARPHGAGSSAAPPLPYVPEIQGLRTIALVLVATFHIWFGKVSGGVDVFLLVSAYLMTRTLVHRAEHGGSTRPIGTIVRKFARIVPLAAATVVLTLVAAWVVLPPRLWAGAGDDAIASGLYWMNIHLQFAQVDYFRMDRLATSAFQQFWSLSVQGQVFVLWPFLHVLGEFLARRIGRPIRVVLVVGFAVIGAASFGYALWFTHVDQPVAYFDTLARLWEFAAGSLLALVQPWIRLRRGVADAFAWIGLAGVVLCGVVLPSGAPYPGVAALWPVLSAALVIMSAGSGSARGAGVLLRRGLLRRAGDYTYALYLVHWPILILTLAALGRPQAGPLSGLAIFVASAVAAVVLTHLVELPAAAWVRRGRRFRWAGLAASGPRGLAAALAPMLVVVGVAGAGSLRMDAAIAAAKAEVNETDYSELGAQAPGGPTEPPLIPSDLIMRMDGTPQGEPCAPDEPYPNEVCLVRGADPATAERSILSVGNSHSLSFNNALFSTTDRQPTWTHRTQMAPGCEFSFPVEGDDECARTWRAATEYAIAEQPDLVVVIGTRSHADADDAANPALLEWIDLVTADSATQVVVIRDNPRFGFVPYDCGQALGFDAPECVGAAMPTTAEVDALHEGVVSRGQIWVDVNESVCPGGACRPSMGGVVTYVDDNHLTEAFGRSLGQKLTDQVAPSVDWWPPVTFAG